MSSLRTDTIDTFPRVSTLSCVFNSQDPRVLTLSRYIRGKVFQFLVGPDEVEFNVYPRPIQHCSEPLWKMMTIGMQETVSKTAKLPEVDAGTFGRFCEWMYTKQYASSHIDQAKSEPEPATLLCDGLQQYHCRSCSSPCSPSIHGKFYPFCSETHRRVMQTSNHYSHFCTKCKNNLELDRLKPHSHLDIGFYDASMDALCPKCSNKQRVASVASQSSQASVQAFLRISIPGETKSHKEAHANVQATPITELVRHAKLYAFADMYMVIELEQLALRQLHHDLQHFVIDKDSIGSLIDLVGYILEHTKRNEEEEGIDLRTLVRSYAVAMAKDLLKYEECRDVLKSDGDFMLEMMESL